MSVQCSMGNINNFVCRKLQISEGCETHMGNGVIQPCVMIIFTLRFEDNTVITLAVVRPDKPGRYNKDQQKLGMEYLIILFLFSAR